MEMNRRQLVIATVTAAACGCLCDVADVLGAPATAPSKPRPGATGGLDVGPMTDYAADGAFDKFAKSDRVMVIRAGDKIYATSASCTHKNCVLKGNAADMSCKCHNSHFSLKGDPTGGPAKRGLTRFGIASRDGHLFVDKSKIITKDKFDADGSFVKVEA